MNKLKNKKKLIVILVIVVLVILIICLQIIRSFKKADAKPSVSVIENGDRYEEPFENLDNWSIYDENETNKTDGTNIFIGDNGYDGKCVYFSGDTKNDARIHRIIEVKPDSYYKITVMAKFLPYKDFVLACVSSMNSTVSYPITNSFTGWKEFEIYINTEKEQSELDLSIGLGNYEEKNAGIVCFDNFTIEKVKYVPLESNTINLIDNNISSSSFLDASDIEIKIVYVIIAIIIFAIILFL